MPPKGRVRLAADRTSLDDLLDSPYQKAEAARDASPLGDGGGLRSRSNSADLHSWLEKERQELEGMRDERSRWEAEKLEDLRFLQEKEQALEAREELLHERETKVRREEDVGSTGGEEGLKDEWMKLRKTKARFDDVKQKLVQVRAVASDKQSELERREASIGKEQRRIEKERQKLLRLTQRLDDNRAGFKSQSGQSELEATSLRVARTEFEKEKSAFREIQNKFLDDKACLAEKTLDVERKDRDQALLADELEMKKREVEVDSAQVTERLKELESSKSIVDEDKANADVQYDKAAATKAEAEIIREINRKKAGEVQNLEQRLREEKMALQKKLLNIAEAKARAEINESRANAIFETADKERKEMEAHKIIIHQQQAVIAEMQTDIDESKKLVSQREANLVADKQDLAEFRVTQERHKQRHVEFSSEKDHWEREKIRDVRELEKQRKRMVVVVDQITKEKTELLEENKRLVARFRQTTRRNVPDTRLKALEKQFAEMDGERAQMKRRTASLGQEEQLLRAMRSELSKERKTIVDAKEMLMREKMFLNREMSRLGIIAAESVASRDKDHRRIERQFAPQSPPQPRDRSRDRATQISRSSASDVRPQLRQDGSGSQVLPNYPSYRQLDEERSEDASSVCTDLSKFQKKLGAIQANLDTLPLTAMAESTPELDGTLPESRRTPPPIGPQPPTSTQRRSFHPNDSSNDYDRHSDTSSMAGSSDTDPRDPRDGPGHDPRIHRRKRRRHRPDHTQPGTMGSSTTHAIRTDLMRIESEKRNLLNRKRGGRELDSRWQDLGPADKEEIMQTLREAPRSRERRHRRQSSDDLMAMGPGGKKPGDIRPDRIRSPQTTSSSDEHLHQLRSDLNMIGDRLTKQVDSIGTSGVNDRDKLSQAQNEASQLRSQLNNMKRALGIDAAEQSQHYQSGDGTKSHPSSEKQGSSRERDSSRSVHKSEGPDSVDLHSPRYVAHERSLRDIEEVKTALVKAGEMSPYQASPTTPDAKRLPAMSAEDLASPLGSPRSPRSPFGASQSPVGLSQSPKDGISLSKDSATPLTPIDSYIDNISTSPEDLNEGSPHPDLPDGWGSTVDADTGTAYYFNVDTGQVQWDPPIAEETDDISGDQAHLREQWQRLENKVSTYDKLVTDPSESDHSHIKSDLADGPRTETEW